MIINKKENESNEKMFFLR